MNGRLNQANGRLKDSKVGVHIDQTGNRLYLRATFPPKPGSERSRAYQQRIALGIHANPAGIKLAEAEARKVGALLDCKEFKWEPYLKAKGKVETVGQWIDQFEQDYFARRSRTPQSQTTWRHDYKKVFLRLPSNQPLTSELLREAVMATEPDTKTRRRFVMVLSSLAKFAGLETDLKPLIGNYSPKRATPRDLPSDHLIASCYYQISHEAWQWAYGVLATYGLRPHELFHLDTENLNNGYGILSILGGKTGPRRVWPCYPEWVDQFNLRQVKMPQVSGATNTDLGQRVTHFFSRAKLPFTAYDLRHCWAVRTLEFGLDISLAAQQMGHSVAVHSELYHAWISEDVHQRAFEALILRTDRPRAPELIE